MTKRYSQELLTRLYVDELKTISDIAIEVGGDREAIRKALHRFGVQVRSKNTPKYVLSAEYLQREYTENGKTQDEIAEMLGCGSTVVFNAMKRHGIVTRPRPEHLKGRKKSLEHRVKLSAAKTGKRTGALNNKCKGGVTTDHTAIRSRTAHNNWRQWILRIKGDFCEQCGKDLNATCNCCGHKPDKHVHHIKDFANHPELRSDPSNGLVLCESCHRSLHFPKRD